jgi:hypothetical protein|tara:strand:+ start:4746 stop:5357 length:612 start_codon:yes stop_codon:yes gene_type:complete
MIVDSFSLIPKRLPNGTPRTFIPNTKVPREDLKLISQAQASIITKNWINNIVLDLATNNKKNYDLDKGLEYDDLHIVTNINKLSIVIDNAQKSLTNNWVNMVNSYNDSMLIFAYSPYSLFGRNEVLFIVISKLDIKEKELKVMNIIQSPFWDEEQIQSIHLKNSLVDQNNHANMTTINFDYLYQDNLRFKLAWDTWFKNIGED